jgi:hypothetical protein
MHKILTLLKQKDKSLLCFVYGSFHERKHIYVGYIDLLYNYNNENIIVDI